jgi:hypothetical protein
VKGINMGQKPIEVNEVLNALHVKLKAHEAGVNKNPPSDATQPDANEYAIVAHYETALRESIQDIDSKLNKLASERDELSNKINIETDKLEYQNLTEQVEPDVRNLRLDYHNKLSKARETEERAMRHKKFFEARNELLGRPARYPDSKIKHLSLIGVIMFIEWIGLSFFYAEGSDFGIAGGIIIAAFFSLVNVSFAILIGYLGRYFNHKNMIKKIRWGIAVLACCLTFTFTTSIAAHYRNATLETIQIQSEKSLLEQKETNITHITRSSSNEAWKAANLAWQEFKESPLGFGNVMTWMMVIAACMFGIFASYKGYRMDDPYPEYGTLDRDLNRKEKIYDDLKNEFRKQIVSHFEHISSKQATILDQAMSNIRRYNQSIAEAHNISSSFSSIAEKIKKNCATVIKIYREENIYVRGSSPPPAYFKTENSLDLSLYAPIKAVSETEINLYNKYRNDLDEFNRISQENKTILQGKYIEALDNYQSWISTLEEEVKEKLDGEARVNPL